MVARDVFRDPPVPRTEHLVLRPVTEADGEGLFGITRAGWSAAGVQQASTA